ncbi:cytochrome c oxidase assembly protein [Sinorhizobium mexicanum]|uniref:Cytochrome c oxidase assembly protein n=1 Tax=Sinorhizobium mexicanum TaxID=375549 RepID=A0A859QHE9_9HYPH|nr:cytochrome c oxidase assembly protein [Sinorhizobium mexicanum]MBP1884327.1 putative membrane protein [Sinorhizobium mexicanum]QLL65012.1 cytochrome c oxidase assembly protein [Sinorhizobium mexicanum]
MRRITLLSGVMLLALIAGGSLLPGSQGSFAGHMLAHMGIVAMAAPLLAVGLSERRIHRSVAALLFAPATPLIASLVELVVVWTWHTPILRAFARTNVIALLLEQATFLAAGLFLWLTSVGQCGGRERATPPTGVFALLLTSVHMTLMGVLLALSPRPLYGTGFVVCFGAPISPQQDQVLGGIIMLATGAVVYLAGGLVLLARLLAPDNQRKAEG